jgi:hypothetical protein
MPAPLDLKILQGIKKIKDKITVGILTCLRCCNYNLDMKRACIFMLFFLASMPFDAYGSDEVGHIVAVKGDILIKRNPAVKGVLNEKVLLDDLVETAAASRVKILFRDESILTLRENSRVHIKKYLLSEGEKRGSSVLTLIDGELKVLVGKNKFEVHTPTAVAAARGTYFYVWMEYDGGVPVTVIAVLEGAVDAYNINPDVSGTVTVGSGYMSKIYEGKPPTEPEPIPTELIGNLAGCTSE